MTSEAARNEFYNRARETFGESAAETLMTLLPESKGATEASLRGLRAEMIQGFEAVNERFDRLYTSLIIAGASAFVGFVGAMVTIVLRT